MRKKIQALTLAVLCTALAIGLIDGQPLLAVLFGLVSLVSLVYLGYRPILDILASDEVEPTPPKQNNNRLFIPPPIDK